MSGLLRVLLLKRGAEYVRLSIAVLSRKGQLYADF
jgi:hypothetical protein